MTTRSLFTGGRGGAWLAALALAALTPARAQQLPLRSFGQLEGLTNVSVQALAQDRAGYLWAGTDNGLYRFDGSRFRRHSLKQNYHINVLHVDPAGRLWVGADRGLFVLDGQQLLPVRRDDGRALPVRFGRHLVSIDAGHLLVQASGRLHQVQPDGKGGWRSAEVFSEAQVDAHPELKDLHGVLRDADGTLWLGCGTRLCRYRDGALTLLGAAEGLPAQQWNGLLRDQAGALWLNSAAKVMRLAPGAQRFTDRSPANYAAAVQAWATPLVQDRDGRVISFNDNGLFRLGAQGWERYGAAQGLHFTSGFHALLLDRDGDAWLGLPGRGVVQWQGYRHWENWTRQEGLPDDDVWTMLRTRDGRLHIGTGAGLAQWDGQRFAARRDGVLASQAWSALAEDAQGGLWLGDLVGVLVRRDAQGRDHQITGMPPGVIYKLLFDAGGQLWICAESGLFLIADPLRAPVPRRVAADLLGADAHVTNGCLDAGGRLWVVGPEGLLRLRDGRWSRQPLPAGEHVFSHVACDGNTIWVADDHGGGLWRGDGAGAQLRLEPLREPLLDGRAVQAMLVDQRHWLWLSTDTGLMVWNGQRWRLFNQRSGMVWNDSNQNALYEDTDGSIWVGTSNGLSHLLRPEALFEPRTIPLQLASLRYNGAAMPGAGADWNGGSLDVQLAAPLYQNHETLSFRYRLLGQETAWSASDTGDLRYTALAPGRYRLQVVAEHSSLQAASAVLELPLVIVPPWWQTGWAYAGAGLLALGLIGMLHRYRVALVLRQRALLERRVAERTAELEASREEHRLRSLKDGLTQAWNRVALMERLAALSAPGAPAFLLVMLDLDYFKRINDTHGHLAGDEVLREVVRRVQAQLRTSDTVGRYGGEEFMLLMPGLDLASGRQRLEQLQRAVGATPVRIDAQQELRISCSCGVVCGRPELGRAPEEWIGLADQALYRAKQLGRNRVEYAGEDVL
ncbi:diguanylate cyclase (GGDEF)-like protein [Duganella sp. SG902]|uniref:diguanylate cyclase n=1 Tax=Duganella sp. SG902 TaxID=2587016 RepID=UPI00159DF5CC|nr:diguanylate cyclase [Duganella sp. SG902]NVM79142.1 diguanylate cyclase (GGDEF)-like protein [Duganella sp. SG902]